MVAADLYELTAVIDEEAALIFENIKGMLAHTHPNISNGELIKLLGQLGMKEFARVKTPCSEKAIAAPRPLGVKKIRKTSNEPWRPSSVVMAKKVSKAEVRRQIWRRDDRKCTNCSSIYAVEDDHRHPKAKGGEYSLSNMRLLCRSCNQRAAIKEFGTVKREKFLFVRRR